MANFTQSGFRVSYATSRSLYVYEGEAVIVELPCDEKRMEGTRRSERGTFLV